MEITRDKLQEHLNGLKVGLAQIEAEFQGQLGSIREAEYWLEVWDAAEQVPQGEDTELSAEEE